MIKTSTGIPGNKPIGTKLSKLFRTDQNMSDIMQLTIARVACRSRRHIGEFPLNSGVVRWLNVENRSRAGRPTET